MRSDQPNVSEPSSRLGNDTDMTRVHTVTVDLLGIFPNGLWHNLGALRYWRVRRSLSKTDIILKVSGILLTKQAGHRPVPTCGNACLSIGDFLPGSHIPSPYIMGQTNGGN